MPERLSQNKTRQQKLLCVSACCISNVVGFIYGLLVKKTVFTFKFNETGNIKHLQLPVYTLVQRRCLDR